MKRLVFVCKGDFCRSAYAEGKVSALGFSAKSFGLEVTRELPADLPFEREHEFSLGKLI